MAMVSEVRFIRAGDVTAPFGVMGSGPIDVVMVAGWISHLEVGCELPELERLNLRFTDLARLITLDKRGVGLSDRTAGAPTLEEPMEDVLAVLDAVGSERASARCWSPAR
jgi:pimeloyl-ACP methyl ester carboxylesterase